MAKLKSVRMNTVLAEQIHTEPVCPKAKFRSGGSFTKVLCCVLPGALQARGNEFPA